MKFARLAVAGLALCVLAAGCSRENGFPSLTGDYLGQAPPGLDRAEIFAPGIVCTGLDERDIAMTPDGSEIYFCSSVGNCAKILVSKRVGGEWSSPDVADFCAGAEWFDIEPCISPDGKRFFFVSDRPAEDGKGVKGDGYIWVMDRTGGWWSAPRRLEGPVNEGGPVFFPSVTSDGTLYLTRGRGEGRERRELIWRSRLEDGAYGEPELLPEQINSMRMQFNAFIAPDESYLIVPVVGRPDGFGSTDYHICFRNDDDTWTEPVNLGERVNSAAGREYSPYVTRDGRYFFFMSQKIDKTGGGPMTRDRMLELHEVPENGNTDIYWIEASFIEALRPGAGH